MMTLSEVNILKSFQYIRREWRNGRWRYWYEKPNQKTRDRFKGGFKEQWKGYKGKPREAFNKLLIERKGQVEDAFEAKLPFIDEDENGKIRYVRNSSGNLKLMKTGVDLVWGNKYLNSGLEHIIDKHLIRYSHYNTVQEVIDDIVNSFEELNSPHSTVKLTPVDIGKNKGTPKYELLTKKGTKLVIGSRLQKNNGKLMLKYFVLTSFESDEDWMAFKNTEEEAAQKKKQVDEYIEKVKRAR